MKKITGKLSLQWRLTLITALLMTVTCILMYFFISQSAVAGMENLGDYMIRIDNTDSAPILFYQPSGITSASQTQPGGKPNRGPEPFRGS